LIEPPAIGVVGVGNRGRQLIEAILETQTGTVVSYADPHAPSLAAASVLVPEAASYTDWRAMLKALRLDVLVIAAPPHLHREIAQEALAAGLDVYCEKPMAPNLEDCDRIVEAARKACSLFYVGFQERSRPVFVRAHKLVRAGVLGRVRMLSYRVMRGPFIPKVDNWIADPAKSGGMLADKNCHDFDLFNWFTGSRAVRVQATGGKAVAAQEGGNPGELLDHAFVLVDYEDGAKALVEVCFFSPFFEELEIVGEKGRLVADYTRLSYAFRGSSEPPVVETFPEDDPHGDRTGWLGFLSCRSRANPGIESVTHAETARESIRIALAGEQSIRTGQPVSF